VAGIEYVASWSEVDNQEGSSPHQKEMRAVGRLSFSSCAVVVQRRRRGPPRGSVPDPSGVVLLSAELPLLSVFSEILPPIFSVLQVLPLFGLAA